MAIISRGENTHLVRVYLGRDPITKKRIEINRTVHGTLAAAKKVEANLKGQKESGHLLKTPQMTLNALLDLYLNSVRHVQAESTQDQARTYFHYYVRPYIGSTPLKQINKSVIQQLFNFLLDEKKGEGAAAGIGQVEGGKGLSPTTVKHVKKLLQGVFNYAINQKLITDNPTHKTKVPSLADSNANSLTIEEAKAFVSVKDDFWFGDAFVFQLHTGLRPQELLALIWEDVDFEQGTVRIERTCQWIRGRFIRIGHTKTKMSDRVIGLAPEHLDLLKTHLEKQRKVIEEHKAKGKPYGEPKMKEWVVKNRSKQSHLYASARLIFPKPDGSVPTHTYPRAQFKEMLKRAGIQSGQTNYRWYDLRHTHATFLLTLGMPNHEVAERMGHSVEMLTSTYTHFLKSRRSAAATLFVDLIPAKSNQTYPPPEKDSEKHTEKDTDPDSRQGKLF